MCSASSTSSFSDRSTDRGCSCCDWTLTPDRGANTSRSANVPCFLQRGICCLELLRTGCSRLTSTNGANDNLTQDEQPERTELVPSAHHSYHTLTADGECDEKSLDSGLQISQESTVGSMRELMVTGTNLHRKEDVMPPQAAVTSVPMYVQETFASAGSKTGGSCDIYRKNQTGFSTADFLPESLKRVKSVQQDYHSFSPKANVKLAEGNFCTEKKSPADKWTASLEGSPVMSGSNGEEKTNSSFDKDFEEDRGRQRLSVEDLFTKRKLSIEDDQLMTSRQIDDIIQVRHGSTPSLPDDTDDDVDDATVAKQPVATAATVTKRLVLLDNDTLTI